jgi:hypothetical protein
VITESGLWLVAFLIPDMKPINVSRAAVLSLLFITSGFMARGQLKSPVSFNSSIHFNYRLNGFLTNDDAGAGWNLSAIFFARKTAGITAEGCLDVFFGDKSLFVGGDEGLRNMPPVVMALRAGPHLSLVKRLYITALYGAARSCIREYDFSVGHSYKISATALLGLKRHLVTNISYTCILRDVSDPSFWSAGIGWRFL